MDRMAKQHMAAVDRVLPGRAITAWNLSKAAGCRSVDEMGAILRDLETSEVITSLAGGDAQMRVQAVMGMWSLAITAMQGMDRDCRSRFVELWDQRLRSSGNAVPQICALGRQWDADLLTEGFWELFHKSNDDRLISAVCFAVYRKGDASVAKALKGKLTTVQSPGTQEILQNALNWMEFRRKGAEAGAGPASAPPRMPDLGE